MKRKRAKSIQDVDDNKRSPQCTFRGSDIFPPDNISDDSDYDSLFDADDDAALATHQPITGSEAVKGVRPALRTAPPVPGLYLDPSVLIPVEIADQLWNDCMETFFHNKVVNQVMLFERARVLNSTASGVFSDAKVNGVPVPIVEVPESRGLPSFLLDLLGTLNKLLKDVVPPDTHTLLFPCDDGNGQARQVILNHYTPGEGITPHVDLLKRYGDGIIGVSLHSGTVMQFAKVLGNHERAVEPTKEIITAVAESEITNQSASVDGHDGLEPGNGAGEDSCPEHDLPGLLSESHSAYLPERSIIVLSGEARFGWTHGISQCTEDVVVCNDGISSELLPRGERLSITFRWLLPGADIVGA